jgi:hypothetical protein
MGSEAQGSIDHLYFVYDADAGLRGELAYVVGKLRGRHCGLCDITHGTLRRKPAFDEFACTLAVPFDVWHRNEQTAEVAAFTEGITPVVVAHGEGGFEVLLDAVTLESFDGDVDAFGAALTAQLERRGATPA